MTRTLTAKVGNTRTIFWSQRGRAKICLTKDLIKARFPSQLKNFLKEKELLFVSVVPQASQAIQTQIKKSKELSLSDIPIRPAYKKGLGVDRLLNLYAARSLSARELVVVDFGTAITVDFLSRQDRHLGGWILPGLRPVSESLKASTAKLSAPRISRRLSKFAGHSSLECLKLGQQNYLDSILRQAQEAARSNLSKNALCIITGGDAILLKKQARTIVEPKLAFIGLRSLLETENIKI